MQRGTDGRGAGGDEDAVALRTRAHGHRYAHTDTHERTRRDRGTHGAASIAMGASTAKEKGVNIGMAK